MSPSTRVRPAGRLRPLVAFAIDFDMTGWPPGRHRGLPGATLPLVISFGAPFTVRRADQADLRAVAVVGGLSSGPVDIVHDGTQRGIQLELTPRGARALLGLPAAELAGGAYRLEEVVGRRCGELTDRLAGAPGPAGRARVLDAVLGGWADTVLAGSGPAASDGYPAAVDAAWRRLTGSGGCLSVTCIAADIGLSRRHLGQLLRAELGQTPKTAARILRFARARECLRTGRTSSLAETAAVCGYFDQAHLSNDWKRLAGCTPGQWIAEELPFLQDLRPGPGGR